MTSFRRAKGSAMLVSLDIDSTQGWQYLSCNVHKLFIGHLNIQTGDFSSIREGYFRGE